MKSISLRAQLALVAASYAAVLGISVLLVCVRYLQYLDHPNDVAAAGGMYAAGDSMLGIFIGCLLLVPTFFLVLVIRKFENLYVGYSRLLLGLSLTAPVCLGLISIPAVSQGTSALGWISMYRLLVSPIVIVGLIVSRLLARFDRAKRLTLYALLIEILTLALAVGLFIFAVRNHRA